MKDFKKLALAILLALPIYANAAGMGLYVPVNVEHQGDYKRYPDIGNSYDIDVDYDSVAGIGLTFDSNIGKDKLFNYRFGLEYVERSIKAVNSNSFIVDGKYDSIGMIHTFGFSIYRNKLVRVWAGPRISIAYEWGSVGLGYDRYGFDIGIAPVIGTNINLGRVVSLGIDLDYKYAYTAAEYENTTTDDSGYIDGTTQGLSARLYVLFRFGERF